MFGYDATPFVLRQVFCHPSHTREVQIGLFWKNNKEVLLCVICATPKIKQSQNQEVAFPLDLSGTLKVLLQQERTFMSKLTRLSKEDLRKKVF